MRQDSEQPDAADIFSPSPNDRATEDLTSRINIEPGVTAVRWEQAS